MVNVIIPKYAKKLGFWTQNTNIKALKIGDANLTIYKMIIIGFWDCK